MNSVRNSVKFGFWPLSKGILELVAGRAATREMAHAMHSLRNVLIAVVVFLSLLSLCVVITTFYVVLKIVEWFM